MKQRNKRKKGARKKQALGKRRNQGRSKNTKIRTPTEANNDYNYYYH